MILICFLLLPGLAVLLIYNYFFAPKFSYPNVEGLNSYDVNTVAPAAISPIQKPQSNLQVNLEDNRAIVLDHYFAANNSPLYGYGSFMISMCDKYSLPSDCTLLPAIAYTETKLCTTDISNNQYNCWGWGGAGANRIVYNDYHDAIEHVSKALHDGYGAILKRPDLIAVNYCGNNCGDWVNSVITQQKVINNLALQLGLPAMK